jgi:hypothetical protein
MSLFLFLFSFFSASLCSGFSSSTFICCSFCNSHGHENGENCTTHMNAFIAIVKCRCTDVQLQFRCFCWGFVRLHKARKQEARPTRSNFIMKNFTRDYRQSRSKELSLDSSIWVKVVTKRMGYTRQKQEQTFELRSSRLEIHYRRPHFQQS